MSARQWVWSYRRERSDLWDGDHYAAGMIPTQDEVLELFAPAIVATCRSVLNTSTPVRSLGDFVDVARDAPQIKTAAHQRAGGWWGPKGAAGRRRR